MKYRIMGGEIGYCCKCFKRIEDLKYLDCECGGLIEVSDQDQYFLKKRIKNIDEITN